MERQIPALSANHVACNGQPKAGASGIKIPRPFEPHEGPKNLLPLIGIDTRPIVIDKYFDTLAAAVGRNIYLFAKASRIRKQICHRPVQRLWPQHRHQISSEIQIDAQAGTTSFTHGFPQQFSHLDFVGKLLPLPPGEGKVAFNHALHLNQICLQAFNLRGTRQHRQLKLHPGQGRAEVMAHPRKHLGTLVYLAAQPIAHHQKGAARATHFRRPFWAEIANVSASPEGVGRSCQAADGANLIPHENSCDNRQNERAAEHPPEKDVDGRAEEAIAGHENLKYTLRAQISPYLHIAAIAVGIDREVVIELLFQRTSKAVVDQ